MGSCLQCYHCETASLTGCRESGKGNLTDCPADRNQGCFIIVTSDSGSCAGEDCGDLYEMGCVDYTDPSMYGCIEHSAGNIEIRSCNCQGDGCNQNLDKASGEPLQCYQCISEEEEKTEFARGCTELADEGKYVCDKFSGNGIE